MTTLVLHVVCPGGRALGAHFKDVEHHGVVSGVRVAPDVVEYAKHVDVQDTFNRELSEEKVYGWDRRSPLKNFLWKISRDFMADG